MVGAFACAALAAAPGCTQDETMFFISRIVAPTKGCGFDGSVDGAAVGLTWGMLDWSCKQEYNAKIVIANALQRNESAESRRTEARRIQIEAIEVTAMLPSGAVVAAYDLPATSIIEPGDARSAGLGLVSVPLLPYGRSEFRAGPGAGVQQINFELRARGHTLSGVSVVSPPFVYPVRIGMGILYSQADGGTAVATCPGQDSYYLAREACPNRTPIVLPGGAVID